MMFAKVKIKQECNTIYIQQRILINMNLLKEPFIFQRPNILGEEKNGISAQSAKSGNLGTRFPSFFREKFRQFKFKVLKKFEKFKIFGKILINFFSNYASVMHVTPRISQWLYLAVRGCTWLCLAVCTWLFLGLPFQQDCMGLDWDWKSLNASHRSGVRANKIPVRNIAGSCADPNILKCKVKFGICWCLLKMK